MITMKELIKQIPISDIPILHQHNLEELLKAANIIRYARQQPMVPSSGYRTLQDHLRIYSEKGIHPPNVPMGSCHLIGAAVDISDPDRSHYNWFKQNNSVLEQAKVFCEEGTKGWVHIQTKPFRSYKVGGTRWFLP